MAATGNKTPRRRAATTAPADPAEQMKVLFPDVTVEVTDPATGKAVTLTVAEYRFLDGLKAQALGEPLIRDLALLAGRAATAGGEDATDGEGESTAGVDLAALEAVVGRHGELWLDLVALASGRDAAWLAALSDKDAREVTGAMWGANLHFFIRRVVAGAVTGDLAAGPWGSLGSWMHLSARATDGVTPRSAGD